jgi:hypothetical protein
VIANVGGRVPLPTNVASALAPRGLDLRCAGDAGIGPAMRDIPALNHDAGQAPARRRGAVGALDFPARRA